MTGTDEQPTPYLEIDAARMRGNIARVAALAASRGVSMRPHVKTHKCVEIARLQATAGSAGITVATIGEAEVFVEAGFDDVFVAYPLWVTEAQAARLRALAERATLSVGLDSAEAAGQLALAGPQRVLVEIDSGHHRSGVPVEEAGSVALAARSAGHTVVGVFTFPGHSYAPDRTTTAAHDEATALATAAASLRGVGIEPSVVSGGSTPSLAASLSADSEITELRPGVYVFGDAQQWELGSCTPDQIALTCVATVVSHAGGRVVLDSGSKALGADWSAFATGFGRLLDHPEARIVILSEHHAVVEMTGPLPALGSRVRVVPNHACNAVNLADTFTVLDADAARVVRRQWAIAARGRNS
ncbi:alanine racemase [Nocardioides jensenii]|uniref:alanine racemase n=1 Tax=Nocardioides jensenii TaxID=1843 RepID=UPI00082E0B2D|nr:alanine racemase [Nocardioides jensenii]